MASQGKKAVDQLLAESFKELACRRPVEKLRLKKLQTGQALSVPHFIITFRINMSCWNGLSSMT